MIVPDSFSLFSLGRNLNDSRTIPSFSSWSVDEDFYERFDDRPTFLILSLLSSFPFQLKSERFEDRSFIFPFGWSVNLVLRTIRRFWFSLFFSFLSSSLFWLKSERFGDHSFIFLFDWSVDLALRKILRSSNVPNSFFPLLFSFPFRVKRRSRSTKDSTIMQRWFFLSPLLSSFSFLLKHRSCSTNVQFLILSFLSSPLSFSFLTEIWTIRGPFLHFPSRPKRRGEFLRMIQRSCNVSSFPFRPKSERFLHFRSVDENLALQTCNISDSLSRLLSSLLFPFDWSLNDLEIVPWYFLSKHRGTRLY